jgi:hypothetical protein
MFFFPPKNYEMRLGRLGGAPPSSLARLGGGRGIIYAYKKMGGCSSSRTVTRTPQTPPGDPWGGRSLRPLYCLVASDLGKPGRRAQRALQPRGAQVALRRTDAGRWSRREGGSKDKSKEVAAFDVVLVTAPIPPPASSRIAFESSPPDDVRECLDCTGAGPIVKVFATFGVVWWPSDGGVIPLVGADAIETLMDVSAMVGRSMPMGFTVGDVARRIEGLTEFELCWLIEILPSSTSGVRPTARTAGSPLSGHWRLRAFHLP